MKYLTLIVISVLATGCFEEKRVVTEFSEDGKLSYCHFGPKIQVLTPETKKDGCSGTAKVQGVRWECGVSATVNHKTMVFLEELNALAETACINHCKSRSSDCVGKFRARTQCGISTGPEDAGPAGRDFKCGKSCLGQGFLYCSIYDAGFRTDEPELIAQQKPNCVCKKRK